MYTEDLIKSIQPLKKQLINHELYSNINTIERLCIFMEAHVFAVWDFMSLLKTLQMNLTCTTVPWHPFGSANTRYLINEIVTGEECDVDIYGKRASHYEMYLDAMRQAGASTQKIEKFTSLVYAGSEINNALKICILKEDVQAFVKNTFRIIDTGKSYLQAAVFTYGREDLIPDMFISFIGKMSGSEKHLTKFKYYLERHIEIDGSHHSLLAQEMTSELCGNDSQKWAEATEAVIQSLKSRLKLWDCINESIK